MMPSFVVEEAKKLFEKHFSFELEYLQLPSEEFLFVSELWDVPQLMEMKNDLNRTKCLLDDKDINEWRKHTKYTNYAGKILSTVRFEIKPEMLTQAWLKFYEIVSKYPIVPETFENFYSFHLCEAPGAFIASMNHYLALERKEGRWLWKANTLNPYYEGSSSAITDDQFIIDTLPNWVFGADNTGNIMNPQYLEDLIKEVYGEMHLVTADGSIDCQGNPTEQERTVSALNYCEIVIALHLLNDGGCFVIKMFTMFECESLCNMFLLNSVFAKVSVFKPATSKAGNSEVYVVCMKFKGREKMGSNFLKVLRRHIGQDLVKAMFPKEFIYKNEAFLAQILKCTQQFKDYQQKAILRNIEMTELADKDNHNLESIKKECARLYLDSYHLREIEEDKFVRYCQCSETENLKWDCNELQALENKLIGGSLNERQRQKEMGPQARISFLKECLSSVKAQINNFAALINKSSKDCKCDSKWIVKGHPYKHILNSKFCFHSILGMWNEVIQYKKVSEIPYNAPAEDDWNWCQLKNKENIFSSLQNNDIFYTGKSEMIELKSLANELHYKREIESISSKRVKYSERKLIFVGVQVFELVYDQYNTEKVFLHQIREMMEVLKETDNVMLSVHGALTRFAAGIIYFLCRLFLEALVINPEEKSTLLANQIWIFSCADVEHLGNIKKHLDTVAKQMSNDETKAVLEILSMEYLCEKWFCSYLRKSNEAFVIRKLHYVLDPF